MAQDIDPRILILRQKREKALEAGGLDRIEKHHARGKNTARERILLLVDKGSFQELDAFITSQSGRDEESGILGDGVVSGWGKINGRIVYVYAQDFTVHGGALGEMHGQKICRVMDLAAQNGVPIIGLIDSGGARIQEGVRSLGWYGEIFHRNVQLSGVIPQISVILGPCAGGAAYSPAVTDFVLMVSRQSYMFLTGPEVIKSVTNEVVDFESLGGADIHLGVSGLAHLVSPSEGESLQLCRRLLSYLPSNNVENPPWVEPDDFLNRMDETLNQIVPQDSSLPYNMHEVVERVVDHGSFIELQTAFARNALIGLGRMNGCPIGIVGQEPSYLAGILDIDAADKITRFVRFCDCFNIPIITFVDSPGFLPGVDQEHRGIIRHGAKVLYAFSEATVPKVTVITRKAYGGAYVVMSSKHIGTDINFAWPSAEIAVMGAEGAANIVYRKQISMADDPEGERARLTEEYRKEYLNPYAAASLGAINEVIEPYETRPKIIAALQALREKQIHTLPRKHGNMPV